MPAVVGEPRRQGLVPLVGVSGASEGGFGNNPRRFGFIQKKLFHCLGPECVVVEGPCRVAVWLRRDVLMEVHQVAKTL